MTILGFISALVTFSTEVVSFLIAMRETPAEKRAELMGKIHDAFKEVNDKNGDTSAVEKIIGTP